MLTDIIDECRARILHYFPERQIYHRTGGEVHYFVLKTRTQVAIVSGLALVAMWCLLTIVSVFWVNNPLLQKHRVRLLNLLMDQAVDFLWKMRT